MNYSISPYHNTKHIEAQQGGDIENFLVSGIKPASEKEYALKLF